MPEHYGIFDNSAYLAIGSHHIPKKLPLGMSIQTYDLPKRTKNSLVNIAAEGAESMPFSWEIAKSGGISGIAGGVVGGAVGGVVGLTKGGVGVFNGAKNGALLGARLCGGAGAAKKSYELEAGLAYEELKNLVDDDGKPIDPELAKRLAMGVGVVNSGLEMIGAVAELSTIPGADKLLKFAKVEATKKILKDKVLQNKLLAAGSKALAKHYEPEVALDPLKEAAQKNIRKYISSVVTESSTEMLQETSNIFASEWAKQIEGNYSDALFSEDGINSNVFKQHLARVVEAGAAAILPAMTMGGIGTSATAINIARKKGLTQQQATEFVENLSQDEKTELINNNEDTLLAVMDDELVEEKYAQIEDDTFNKMKNAGIDEGQAFSGAKLVREMARSFGDVKKAQKWAENIEFRRENHIQAQSPILQGGVEMNVNPEKLQQLQQKTLYQSAMYKSPKKSFDDFYEQVQQDKNPKQKAYYTQQTKQGVNIDIFHDVVRHDEKKHSLSKEEWSDLFNSIDDNIEDKIIANKSYYRGTPLLLKVNVNGNYYGVSMEVFPDRHIITTAFKSTEKGVDTWFEKDKKKSAGTTAPNHQSGSSIAKNNNVISGQTLTDIINDVKRNFNPNVKSNVLFQSAYHSTPHRFDEFSTEHIGTGEGAQAISSFANQFNLSIEEAEEKFGFKVQSMTEEEAKEQQKKDNVKPEQVYYQLIGEKGANNLGDKLLYRAKNLEANGATPEEIYKKSGWYRGADNKWRMEISDGKAIENPKIERVVDEETGEVFFRGTLEDIYDNPALYKAYPHLADLKISIQNMPFSTHGYYNGEYLVLSKLFFERQVENKTKQRRIKELEKTTEYKKYDKVVKLFAKDNEKYGDDLLKAEEEFLNTEIGKKYDNLVWNTEDTITAYGLSEQGKSTLVHEIQHAIQDFEQFAKGGNLKTRQKFADELNRLYINALLNQAHKAKEELIKIYGWDKADEIIDVMFKYYEPAPYSNLSQDEKNKLYSEFWGNQSDETFETTERIWKENKDTEALNKINTLEKEYNLSEYDFYKNIYGEVEARNVQTRVNLTEEQRKQSMPENTQDVTNDKAILVFKNSTSFLSRNNIKITPIHIENNAVPEKERVADVKDWIIENLNLLGDITVQSNGRVIKFSKGNINRSMKDIGRNKARRNSYAKLKELVETSIHDDIDIRPADEKHKNVLHQELYYNAINYNGRTYGVEISVDIPKSEKTPNTYAGHKVKIIEMEPSAIGVHQKGTTSGTDSTISINDIRTLFNPNITDYYQFNIEEEQGSDGFINRHNIAAIHKAYREGRSGNDYLGYFYKVGEKTIITVMDNANPSTVIHELAHCFLEALKDFAYSDEQAAQKLEAVKKWFGVTDNNFTRDHHEKFAAGFEAYVYNNRAPNRKLQEVFDQFKEWLKGIHDYWLNNKDGFVMKPEIKEVFDKLFEEKPPETKKQKRIKKYVETAKNIKLDDDYLSDSQYRHKEIAYEIVSIATGKNKKYLRMILESTSESTKISKQKEEIARLCNECDDKITVNGFMPEWAEFYSNAAFYQNNDYMLAEAALSDIQNKSYRNTFTTADYFNEYQAQYEYLINTYREDLLARDEIFTAVWSWLDDVEKQDMEAAGFFAEKFIDDMKYIERFEKLSKIEQAKEKILAAVKALKHGDYKERAIAENTIKEAVNSFEYETLPNQDTRSSELAAEIAQMEQNLSDDVKRFRDTVRKILNQLNFLTPKDKARMFANILDAPNANFLEATIDNIMDLAQTMNEVQFRKILMNKISEELRETKNKKQSGHMVGKYDYRTNKLFEELRNISKLTKEQANDKRLERLELLNDAEDEGMTFEDRILNTFIQIKADGSEYANTPLIKQFYDDLLRLKLAGKTAKDEKDLSRKLNNRARAEELAKILESKKDGNFLEQLYTNTVANWESMVNTFFNKKMKDKYLLIYAETKASTWVHKEKQAFEKEVGKIYGLSTWNFDAIVLKNLSEVYTFMKNNRETIIDADGKVQHPIRRVVPFKMNKMELILTYMWDKNEVQHERLINMFGEEQLIDMIDTLSEQDKKLGDLMMRTVNKYYPLANEVYIKKYGIDLPKVSAYFPSVAEREGSLSEIDLFKDYTQKNSTPSFSKSRSQSAFIPLKFSNPVSMLYHHIDTMGRFIHMTEPIDTINKAFNTADVKDLIRAKYGDKALQEFLQQIVNISYKQNATIRTEQMRIVNEMVGGWTSGNIIGKASTGIKQLFAALNYSTVMPVGEWTQGFLEALANPKETIDYMYNKIDYLQYRFEAGAQNEALKQFINNNAVERWISDKFDRFVKNEKIKKMLTMTSITAPRKVKDVASLFLRLGDMGAIIFGGKPYIDYLIKQGMSETEAIKQFVIETQRTQQSAEISTLSNWQVAASSNPFSKLFMNYKNAQGQFIRKIADSTIDYSRGEITKTQLAKDIFMYGFFQSFLFKAATSLSLLTLLNTGNAKDLWDDLITSIFDNFTFFHIFGDISVWAINLILTGDGYISTSPLFGDITKEILKVAKDGADIEDWVHAMGFAMQAKEGIPVNAFVNEAGGVGDILQGDFQKGTLRVLGWSKYRAQIATGENPKKGKKKKRSSNAKSLY